MRQPQVVYRRDIEYQHKHANFGTALRATFDRIFRKEVFQHSITLKELLLPKTS
jgi:hypothetical protein